MNTWSARIHVRTVVLGVVMLVISICTLVSLLTSTRIDAGLITLILLIGAGAALVTAGVTSAVRQR